MTFQDKDLSRALRARVVESRLHMDGADRVAPHLLAAHRRLQQELIGLVSVPNYAILDPFTGDFLFRMRLRGGDEAVWRRDFQRLLARLPDRPSQK